MFKRLTRWLTALPDPALDETIDQLLDAEEAWLRDPSPETWEPLLKLRRELLMEQGDPGPRECRGRSAYSSVRADCGNKVTHPPHSWPEL